MVIRMTFRNSTKFCLFMAVSVQAIRSEMKYSHIEHPKIDRNIPASKYSFP